MIDDDGGRLDSTAEEMGIPPAEDESPQEWATDAAAPDTEGRQAPVAPEPGELTEAQLEALLFVAEKPLSRNEIAGMARVDREVVDARLGDLAVSLSERGIRLVDSGEKVELATAPEAGALIARYVGADAPRISSPSLETLAIVAYRQPCTRATIERIRGVDSDYTIRTLLHRRLVVELGRSEAPGRPILYGTGFDFLERFGMTSIDELPPLDAPVAERLFAPGPEDETAEPAVAGDGAGDGAPTASTAADDGSN
jgi:segregation and condensation protein B